MRNFRMLLPLIFLLCLSACNSTNTRDQITTPPPSTKINTPPQSDQQATPSEAYKEKYAQIKTEEAIRLKNKLHDTDPTDVWQRIRNNLVIQRDLSKKSTQERIAWYKRNQEYLDRVTDRATPYIHHVLESLEKRGMPFDLALLPIVESAYHPFAYSPSRASGIWQFIPSTGKIYGLKQNWWYDGRRDIVAATDAALNYLQKLHKEFNGDWLLALAAYNSGERNVARAIQRNQKAGKPINFWALSLPRETRGYVPSLLAVAEIVSAPEKYNISLKTIPNKPYFVEINIGNQIDLATAAQLAELNMDELYTLNPGFNRWATDPNGPHRLLIPVDKAEAFKQNLANLTDDERIKWQQHNIQKGETLGGIAFRYHTDVSTLRQINRIKGNTIRTGRSLLIPVSSKPLKHYTLSLDSRRFKGLKRTGDGTRYTYSVKRGDTLWDIGRHYGISVRQLCAWNGISSRSILRPGKKLVVWINDDQEAKPEVVTVAAKDISAGNSQRISYTVQEGDSLWLISRRYGVSISELLKWNSLKKRSYLQPGQNLDIYIGKPPTDA